MNSEAQRLAEEAKHYVDALNAVAQLFESTRPGAEKEIHEQAVIACDELKAIIDRLASLQSADQAREIEIRKERYELGRAVALEEAAKIAEGEPRVWGPAPDPQTRIAAKIRALASTEQTERNEGEKR